MSQSAILLFLPVYLREDLEYSAVRVGVHMSLAYVAGIGAQPIIGALSDRFGRKAILIPSMVVLGLLFVALKYAEPGFQLAAVIVAMGTFLYSLHAIFIAAASDLGGSDVQSTTASLTYGATFIGSTVSPVIAGLFADSFGVPSAFLYSSALLLIAVVGMAALRLPRIAAPGTGTGTQQGSSG